MTPNVSLAEAMRDPSLLGAVFAAPSFWPWHAVAKMMSGEPLDVREEELFHACTGRSRIPTKPVHRLKLLVGRRGGKDRFSSAVGVHQATLASDWSSIMSAGEQAVVIMIGTDKKQARILRRYCAGLLANPLLASEIVRDTDEMIEFRNGAALEIASNDASLVRGRSAIAVIGTEACYWTTDESRASSDEEVVAAAEPAMAMTPGGGLLLMQSSVYRRQGYMYRSFKDNWGNDDAEEIVWLATSQQMNPALPGKVVEDAMRRDLARASAEFNSQWRDDVSNLVSPGVVTALVAQGVMELSPADGVSYFGFVDPAGGSGQDAMTLAIAHVERDVAILDRLEEVRPPFSPDETCGNFCAILARYRLREVTGDRWGAEFTRERFETRGITYIHSDRTKGDLYRELLPLMNSRRIRLLDNSRMLSQLLNLERRTSRGGKDSIDHAQGQHDDSINAAAGALILAAGIGSDGFDGEEYLRAFGPTNLRSFARPTWA